MFSKLRSTNERVVAKKSANNMKLVDLAVRVIFVPAPLPPRLIAGDRRGPAGFETPAAALPLWLNISS
jgi:hypothetical protein